MKSTLARAVVQRFSIRIFTTCLLGRPLAISTSIGCRGAPSVASAKPRPAAHRYQNKPSPQEPAARQITSMWVWLVLIYVVAVLVHFACLRPQSIFPLLVTDEVQYISVGENLRLGHGFTTHGEFHAAMPPLYPLFVAFAHSIGSSPRTSALWFSCFAICLAVFPAYGLARSVDLSRPLACLVAAASVF